ncbi:hypothetical protein K7432_001806 [Basidiobolus ranarum]|uniref:Lysozyme-like protein n=1 Tax=Basidiobolus ranarum TaxID=34480 RepID=A0ABR2X2H6_9FUNG
MFKSICLVLVAWPSIYQSNVQAKETPFCTKEYEKSPKNCGKFQFVAKKANCNPNAKMTREFYNIKTWPIAEISSRAKKYAEIITNVFENGNEIYGYAACEKLNDGRGFTCGRIGFTTGTGDALTVLHKYEEVNPRSALSKYIPTLEKIDTLAQCDSKRDDTSELVDFDKTWTATSCKNSNFNGIQDQINDDMYFTPALKFAKRVGVESNLGKAIFYDTIIQHGWQMNEADINLVKIITVTGSKGYLSEKDYLAKFLKTRRQLLCCYPDDTWPPSADRVSDLQDVLSIGDLDLQHPIFLPNYGVNITGNEITNTPGPQCK